MIISEFEYASGVVAGGSEDLITVYFICKTATNFPIWKRFFYIFLPLFEIW